ncbi:MAG: HEAT repeat domain-containing protein [Planctomycetia bacterium]|nr:HEAT repeat domain-containing protein [Planctomycetia bacterium]
MRRPLLTVALLACMVAGVVACADDAGQASRPLKTQQELMSDRGFVRYRGSWRTVQEIELIERAERANLAQKEWTGRLERLRKQLDRSGQADQAAEEIREIADPFAVPALAAAVAAEPVFRVRSLYVEALGRIRSADALATLAVVAVDHADPETRIAAVERLVAIGPQPVLPMIVAALASPDNARINRAAEAIGRLVGESPSGGSARGGLVGTLIAALETQHMAIVGDGTPEGSTTATFTPAGGGLAVGGGAKRVKTTLRNERVLETLVTITGANFEWNAAAWRAWLASREAPPDYDPRRGL